MEPPLSVTGTGAVPALSLAVYAVLLKRTDGVTSSSTMVSVAAAGLPSTALTGRLNTSATVLLFGLSRLSLTTGTVKVRRVTPGAKTT